MRVRDIMTQPAVVAPVSSTIQQAAQLMTRHHVGALAVCESERIGGIVTDRDLPKAE